jgi:hypothetical protein
MPHRRQTRPASASPSEQGAPSARPWSERVSDASRILPKHRGASVSAACPPGELPDQLLDRLEVESEAVTLCGVPVIANVA